MTLPRHTVYNSGGSFIPLLDAIHVEGTGETIPTMMALIVIARSEGHLISFGGSDVTVSSRTRTIPVPVGGQILESNI